MSVLDQIADNHAGSIPAITPNQPGKQIIPPVIDDRTPEPAMRLQSSACIIRLLSLGRTLDAALKAYSAITEASRTDQVTDAYETIDRFLQSARKDIGILKTGDK